ncbi:MAG: potassium transporter Kup [Deltaproteobacteria bacterium]
MTHSPERPQPAAQDDHARGDKHGSLFALALGSVGVVYGDIGTSPLYAFRETLHAVAGGGFGLSEVTGIISLLIWTLMIIVTAKYVMFLLTADNKGEGGDLALFARVQKASRKRTFFLLLLGILGAAFFFGDAILTPAISVLSAVEGIALVAPGFEPLIVPTTLGVLIALFIVQRGGTGKISAWFGPITALWFLTMAGLGIYWIVQNPSVLWSLSPAPGLRFLFHHTSIALIVLAGVFLAVTGAEALYADLGHFGKNPIRLAWFALVLPSLVLNYLGQGALVLTHAEAAENPFFLMAPELLRGPVVALATVATIIASQAVITGAFSVARAALQLGLLPRLEIRHTSEDHFGQIYIPTINWILMFGVVLLVLSFGSSTGLAHAYGILVSGSMIITSTLSILYLKYVRRWHFFPAIMVMAPIMAIELCFVSANALKFFDGGYVPVGISTLAVIIMLSWSRGTAMVAARTRKTMVSLSSFIHNMAKSSVVRVPGVAFFLTSDMQAVPPALLHNLKHNRVLHEKNVVITVEVADTPRVPEDERIELTEIDEHFSTLRLRFGFMETPNVSKALIQSRKAGLKFDVMATSFFLGRRRLVIGQRIGMSSLMDKLYVFLTRFAADPIDYFHLPRDRVVEIGARMSV